MKFEIGQKVVCVNDSPHLHTDWCGYPIHRGQIYVIRDNIVEWPYWQDQNCVRLEGIYRNDDLPYREDRFEALQKTSIEIFKRMLVSKELEKCDER